MKARVKWLTASLICLAATSSLGQTSVTLPVPNTPQEQTNWCWAACTSAILSYAGNAQSQCTIVDWVRTNQWNLTGNCCSSGSSAECNRPNNISGIEAAMRQFRLEPEVHGNALSQDDLTEELERGAPVLATWKWTDRSVGHAVVFYGITSNTVLIMDPWNGVISQTYSQAVRSGTRSWTRSIAVPPTRVTFVVDVTGSMGDEIASVRSDLLTRVNEFDTEGRFVEYHLVTYRDDVTYVGMTRTPATIRTWIGNLTATGGGDCAEEGYGALDRAADEAEHSEIWWMTDADSHGGWARMLTTRLKLLIARCRLHSVIFGSCTLCKSDQSGSAPADAEDCSLVALEEKVDVQSYVAGRELSGSTGGLNFAATSGTVRAATAIIMDYIESIADHGRVAYPAGSSLTTMDFDSTTRTAWILLNTSAFASSALSVTSPSGTVLIGGAPGVEVFSAGSSRMYKVYPPALESGGYRVAASSNAAYEVIGASESIHAMHLISTQTAGIEQITPIQVSLAGFGDFPEPMGPGGGGPGSPGDVPEGWLPVRPPVSPEELTFGLVNSNGDLLETIAMYDDGLHGDNDVADGVFGGTYAFESAGRYFLVATNGSGFRRVSDVGIAVSSVALSTPANQIAAPGEVLQYSFVVTNVGDVSRSFNVGASSSRGWLQGATVPAQVVLPARSAATIVLTVIVPTTATRGLSDILSMTVVASDDPSISGSVAVETLVWTGPSISSVAPNPCVAHDIISVTGRSFGDNLSNQFDTELDNVTIGEMRIPAAYFVDWADTAITFELPSGIESGLVQVTAEGLPSNAVELVVIETPFEGCVWHDDTTSPLDNSGLDGHGVAWGDLDGDGDDDLYLANNGLNKLLRNEGGGVFSAVAHGDGEPAYDSRGATWADFDNDGDLDLYVVNWNGPNVLYRNDAGVLVNATAGDIACPLQGNNAAWADVEGDGDLDVFVTNFDGPNKLLRNDGGGVFTWIASAAGFTDKSRGCAWGDYDNDLDQDLYVSVEDGPNHLFRNDGGVLVDVTVAPLDDAGMGKGVDWGDFDNDGDLDLYLVNRFTENRLFVNDGGVFSLSADPVVADTGDGRSCGWGDYNNDGWLDLFVTNYSGDNKLFHNLHGTFADSTCGDLRTPITAWGMGWNDHDRDGDLDLYVSNHNWQGLPSHMFRNDLITNKSWVSVRLNGTLSNRDGVGARIVATDPATGLTQMREITAGSSYMSQRAAVAQFGLADASRVDLTIYWPSGAVQVLENQAVNVAMEITETTGAADAPPVIKPFQYAVSNHPNPFNPQTRIEFALPVAGGVTLTVYDVDGRLVKTLLADVNYGEGEFSVVWNGTDNDGRKVASGVYFYRFESGTFSRAGRMVMLK